jgi:microcystin-dependent protein
MTFYKWSQDPATNAAVDSSINYQEGQAPASLNDSARAAMAALAKWRDDVGGAIVTTGTSTAYAVASYEVFNSLANMSGKLIAFTPHATNGGTTTLNVDGLGAKALRSAPNVELPSGVLVAGSPYIALYSNADNAFYLHGFYTSPALVPIGTVLPYAGATAPNSNFALCYGQAVSRATYATLYGLTSTIFGSGDGSTTFNLPDLRGRVVAGADAMGGAAAGRLTDAVAGIDSLGDAGGAQTRTLVTANLPPYTPTVASASVSVTSTASTFQNNSLGNVSSNFGGGATDVPRYNPSAIVSTGSASITMNAQGGTSTPVVTVQPTLIMSYIVRTI